MSSQDKHHKKKGKTGWIDFKYLRQHRTQMSIRKESREEIINILASPEDLCVIVEELNSDSLED